MSESEITTTCPRHPKTPTNLRCASCGTLICPKCLVQTPVGAKCRDCAAQRGNRLFTLTPMQGVGAVLAGLASGAVAGWGVEFLFLWIYTIFLAFAYGAIAGEMILRAAGRTRGLKMEIIAGVSMTLGALGGRLVVGAIQLAAPGQAQPPLGLVSVLADLVIPSPIPLIALAVAIGSAVSRIRYI